MDWRYKHFNQEAVFNASIQEVLEAGRAVVTEAFGPVEETREGFTASGRSGWHNATAEFQAESAASGTRLTVELQVERATMRGYMLFDMGGYYNVQIDKWFAGIAQRLGQAGQNALVSKTTTDYRVRQGCLAGCLVWLFAAACLGGAGYVLDRAIFPQFSESIGGPFSLATSALALAAGIVAYVVLAYPENQISRFIRERLPGAKKDREE